MQSYKLKGITICARYGRRNQNIVFFFFCQDNYASEALLIEGNVKLFYACLVYLFFAFGVNETGSSEPQTEAAK